MRAKELFWLVGFALFIVHAMIVAEDIQVILQDPNKADKPGEILKTAIDITRYFG